VINGGDDGGSSGFDGRQVGHTKGSWRAWSGACSQLITPQLIRKKLGDWDIGHCLSESDSYRLSMCFFVFDWILTDIVLPSGGEKIAGFCGLLRGLGVADLGRRCVLCVDRECVRVGGEKTENAKPGDRSPSPRYYYGGRGIFERFKSTFPP